MKRVDRLRLTSKSQGWFISYAEAPRTTVEDLQLLLVLYTRLCYNIVKDIQNDKAANDDIKRVFMPKKTHILVEAKFGRMPVSLELITSSEGVPQVSTSLSSSLPAGVYRSRNTNRTGIDQSSKRESRQRTLRRVEAIHNHIGDTGADMIDFMNRGGPEVNGWYDAGNCAETLSLLRHVHVFAIAETSK